MVALVFVKLWVGNDFVVIFVILIYVKNMRKFMKSVYKYNQDNPLDFSQEIIHLLKLIDSKLEIDKSGLDLMNRILN